MLNKRQRYQQGLKFSHLYPQKERTCACGCETVLSGKRTKWSSDECRDSSYLEFSILKGNTKAIRREVFKRDQGFCHHCGVLDSNWEADHVHPVKHGGGACTLGNLQTLCKHCHDVKTSIQMVSHIENISSQEATA